MEINDGFMKSKAESIIARHMHEKEHKGIKALWKAKTKTFRKAKLTERHQYTHYGKAAALTLGEIIWVSNLEEDYLGL